MENSLQLSVISPMYNEEAIIESSVLNIVTAIKKIGVSWELILVNDGSIDSTGELIESIANNDDHIKIVSYEKNRGRGYALRQGFNASCGKFVITTESDLTWGKSIIHKLYSELLETEADIVIASPYTKGGCLENVPFKRALLSNMGNKILKLTVPEEITMLSGMTRGYTGKFIRSIPLEEDCKEIHLEIVSKAVMLDAKFSEVPAKLRWNPPAKQKTTRKSKFNAKKLIISHLNFSFNEAPILLFGVLGSMLILMGILLGLNLSYLYFLKDQIIGDRITQILLCIFFILSGLSTFMFCFLSYQIKQLKTDIFKLYCTLYQEDC
jgi:glycosyltransferase involved in cell wall biosynthesis